MTSTIVTYIGWWAGLLALASRREFHWYQFIFKAITGKLPHYLTSLLDWSLPSYSTRSSEWLLFRVPRTSTQLGETAFSYAAPRSWNLIQKELKLDSLPTLSEFKTMVSSLCISNCTHYSHWGMVNFIPNWLQNTGCVLLYLITGHCLWAPDIKHCLCLEVLDIDWLLDIVLSNGH